MTTLLHESIKCSVCKQKSDQRVIGSTNTFGSMDTDTRPPEMERSTMPFWVQKCTNCGYCSLDLSNEIDGAKKNIKQDEYISILNNKAYPELARQFLCNAYLLKESKEFRSAGYRYLNAAWVCDDENMKPESIFCRKQALKMFDLNIENNKELSNDDISSEKLLMTDIARRAEMFEQAYYHKVDGYDKTADNVLIKIFDFQEKLIEKKDSGCHNVEEVNYK